MWTPALVPQREATMHRSPAQPSRKPAAGSRVEKSWDRCRGLTDPRQHSTTARFFVHEKAPRLGGAFSFTVNSRSKGQLDLAQQQVLAVERSLGTGCHAEAGVLVIRLEFHVTSEIPVEADSRFAGEPGRAGSAGEAVGEGVATNSHLTVAESEFKRAEVIEAAGGLERVAGTDSRVSVLLSGEQNRALGLPGFVSDSSRDPLVQYFLGRDDILAHEPEGTGVVVSLGCDAVVLAIRDGARGVLEESVLPDRLQAGNSSVLIACRSAHSDSEVLHHSEAGLLKGMKECPSCSFVPMGPLGEDAVRSVARSVEVSAFISDGVRQYGTGKLSADVAERDQIRCH